MHKFELFMVFQCTKSQRCISHGLVFKGYESQCQSALLSVNFLTYNFVIAPVLKMINLRDFFHLQPLKLFYRFLLPICLLLQLSCEILHDFQQKFLKAQGNVSISLKRNESLFISLVIINFVISCKRQ